MSGGLGAEAVEPSLDVRHFLEPTGVQIIQALLDQRPEPSHATGFVGVEAVGRCVEDGFASVHELKADPKPGFLKAPPSSRMVANLSSHGETIAGLDRSLRDGAPRRRVAAGRGPVLG